jgi:hypothetical protein
LLANGLADWAIEDYASSETGLPWHARTSDEQRCFGEPGAAVVRAPAAAM